MKKMLLLLLVAGILMVGIFSTVEEILEENSYKEDLDPLYDNFGDGIGDPAPCGGGGGNGDGDVPG